MLNLYIVGGENYVSKKVKSQLYYDISSFRNTYRISGENRAETALENEEATTIYKYYPTKKRG